MSDLQLFNIFYNLAGRHWIYDGLFIFFAKYLPYALILGLLVLIFYNHRQWRERFYFIFLSSFSLLIARGILVEVIRFFYQRSRPFLALDFEPLIDPVFTNSLPSGHATVFFAVAALIFFIDRRYFWYFLSGAVLVSLGRILVGVHWPSDVLIGALLGAGSVIVAKWLLPESYK